MLDEKMEMMRHVEPKIYCSFCNKSREDVSKLVATGAVYICNECIDLAHKIIHGDSPDYKKMYQELSDAIRNTKEKQ